MGGGLDQRRSGVDLRQLERTGAGDVDEDAARAVNGAGLKQRRSHGGLGCFYGAIFAGTDRGAHDRVAHARHGGFHVGKVAVDDAGDGDDVRDALHALSEHVVGHAETLKEAGVLGYGKQLLVGNDDHGVDTLQQFFQAAFGLLQAALAFEGKRARNYGNSQNAHFAGQRSDDRRCAGAGAAAEPGGDEDHVGPFEGFDDLV